MSDAKKGLALTFGVAPEAIEITIRGENNPAGKEARASGARPLPRTPMPSRSI